MAESGGLGLDFLTQIVNVHWGGGLHFLYSGADGMFGSEDGKSWKPAPSSVPATGLAWVDGMWLATGLGGPWRSEDGGKTWKPMGGPAFEQIAACNPKVGAKDDEGRPIKNGIFAGYKQDEEGDNEEVYLSKDLGQTWIKELTIPTEIPFGDGEDGFEFARVLSGCGNGIFLSTIKADTSFSVGDGCVYVSIDGGGFGERQQVWTGTTNPFDEGDPHRIGYSPGAVGFDSKTKRFCLTCYKQEEFGPGGASGNAIQYSIIYATASDGSFSGETEIITSAKAALAETYTAVAGGLAAAGGDGKFATTYRKDFAPAFSGELFVSFLDGTAHMLISLASIFGTTAASQAGPLCWKPSKESESTDAPTGTGTFACAAFGVDAEEGGVWIHKGSGGWDKTHIGQGLTDDPRGARSGLAVGRLSWLDSDDGA